jgi:hypothetical protein
MSTTVSDRFENKQVAKLHRHLFRQKSIFPRRKCVERKLS